MKTFAENNHVKNIFLKTVKSSVDKVRFVN